MTVTAGSAWTLTDFARHQLEEAGISRAELFRLLKQPEMIIPAREGRQRYNGYGLSALLNNGAIEQIVIDGATVDNWQEWARERAEFGDSDVAGADEFLRETILPPKRATPPKPRKARPSGILQRLAMHSAPPIPAKPVPSRPSGLTQTRVPETARGVKVQERYALEDVHPSLRRLVAQQVGGDFTRLVVHSPTKVTILPERDDD